MATEVNEEAYQTLRDFVDSGQMTPDAWDYIELRDELNDPIIQVSVTGDSRASWTHVNGEQVLVAEINVSGSDADIPLNTSVEGSAMYNDPAGPELSYDSFPTALIETEQDDLKVEHRIEIPQVV